MLLRSVLITVLSTVFSAWSQFNADANTLALYHFDEGQGTVATDASSNHWDGALTGCTWVNGRFGKALSFNGVSDFVSINHTLPIRNISFELWIHSTDTMSGGFPLNTYGGYDQGFEIFFSKDSVNFFTSSPTGTDPHGTFPDKQSWIYLAATIDNSDTIRLYVNGNLVDKQFDWAVNRTWSSFYFGAVPFGMSMTNFYKGIIDEARISSCVRTPAEIKNAFVTPPPTLISAAANGRQILLSFDQFTDTPAITFSNIDSIFPISGGHTWLSGFGTIDSAIWNPQGTKLLITLSIAFSSPTISIGDSISFSRGKGKVILTGTLDLPEGTQSYLSRKQSVPCLEIAGSVIRCSIPEIYRGDRIKLGISDLSGRVVLSSEIATANSGYFTCQLPKLPRGCFVLCLKVGHEFYRSIKLIGVNDSGRK
ncbi:MAG TPA: LamG-like jellyroll fold domain-containing protein [Chitinivibrionales bacterium]|nr:LamG-like jellyroll fold domain-containing protein [Chitinivibrionales bacterium]